MLSRAYAVQESDTKSLGSMGMVNILKIFFTIHH